MNIATKDNAFLFFENGALEIKNDEFLLVPYEDYDGFVFEEQIINHSILLSENDFTERSMFNSFLFKVSNNDISRYHYLTSSIGYLIHGYKV